MRALLISWVAKLWIETDTILKFACPFINAKAGTLKGSVMLSIWKIADINQRMFQKY